MTTQQPTPLLISTGTAARILDCKPGKIRSMIRRGKLRTVNIDGMRRIPREDVEAYLPCNGDLGSTAARGAQSQAEARTSDAPRLASRRQRALERLAPPRG